MKKVIIINNNMYIGGVQKALVSLICNIKDRYDVTLLLFHPSGEYIKNIPEGIKVIAVESDYRYLGIARRDIKGKRDKLKRNFYAAVTRIFGRGKAIKLMSRKQKKLTGYDAAISYLHNAGEKVFYGGCVDFVLNHVDAEKKIAVLHCDYTNFDTVENAEKYKQFDLIVGCSEGCRASFVKCLPELKGKTAVLKNHHEFDNIRSLADADEVSLSHNFINILTVARLGREKGVHRGVEAINALGELKSKVKYHIIGDGIQRAYIEELITKYGLGDVVTMHGEMDNPYGYMKAADLLLIPSYNEAAPLVIGEAACLGLPVLSTRTSSANEMIEDTGFGWVCDNSVKALADILTDLVSDAKKIYDQKQQLSEIQHTNDIANQQFDMLI